MLVLVLSFILGWLLVDLCRDWENTSLTVKVVTGLLAAVVVIATLVG